MGNSTRRAKVQVQPQYRGERKRASEQCDGASVECTQIGSEPGRIQNERGRRIDCVHQTQHYRVLIAGIIGAGWMSFLLMVLRLFGITSLNIEMGLGNLLTGEGGVWTWVLGFLWHLLNGIGLAFVFAWIFKKLEWKGPRDGAIIGFAYWFVASMTIGTFPQLDVLVAPGAGPAGPFGAFLGNAAFYALLISHLGFGAIVGWLLNNG